MYYLMHLMAYLGWGDLHVKNCSGQSVLLTFVNKGG